MLRKYQILRGKHQFLGEIGIGERFWAGEVSSNGLPRETEAAPSPGSVQGGTVEGVPAQVVAPVPRPLQLD